MSLTAQQVANRGLGLGGSDCAAVFGMSPWKSPYQLWREKRGLDVKPFKETESTRWGTMLETAIAQRYADVAKVEVVRMPDDLTMRSPSHPFMLAHIDGAIRLPGAPVPVWDGKRLNTPEILEVKMADVHNADAWGEIDSDEVPPYYILQGAHYLAVTGADLCRFAVLIGGNDFRRYTVPRDPAMIAMVQEGEAKFWRMVETDEAPPATTAEDVKLKYRLDTGATIDADAAMAANVALLKAAREAKDAAEAEEARIGLLIRQHMGDAAVLNVGGKPAITWKTAKGAMRLDTDLLEAMHPGATEACKRAGATSRRFLVK